MTPTPLLTADGLSVRLTTGPAIVDDVSLRLHAGEILALVGESGSGKTTTALALLGATPPAAYLAAGSVAVAGESLLGRTERDLRRLRGRLVSYVAQEPGSALNPALRIGRQIAEIVAVHAPHLDRAAVVARALERVGLPSDRAFQRRYPHQLSGGQQQRVCIAQALVLEPPFLVLDEPTTGLDVVTQAGLLDEIRRLRDSTGVGIVYVTHDLAAVASLADRLAVMYAGRIVEEGPTAAVLAAPAHPYTAGLVASVPDPAAPRKLIGIPGVAAGVAERPSGCAFTPRCPQQVAACHTEVPLRRQVQPGHAVRCGEWTRTPLIAAAPLLTPPPTPSTVALLRVEGLRAVHRTRRGLVEAVRDVSFTVALGECLALVGPSGSGKTTIARCLAGLHHPCAGVIRWQDEALAATARQRTQEQRGRIQLVFQNPSDSLNPRQPVGAAIARPARLLHGETKTAAGAHVAQLLERVRLPAAIADRYAGELSGGEQQRVALARALAARPQLLICDEITSALDVSVQAAVLDLLAELRADLGLAILFISHDLGVVAHVADRVVVLHDGAVTEAGPVRDVLDRPRTPDAQRLVAAAPRLAEVRSSQASRPAG